MPETSPKARWERLLLAAMLLCTLGLTFRLWDQPSRTEALSTRVEALERALQAQGGGPDLPGAPPAVAQHLREQQIAASVVQALAPRLEELAQCKGPAAEKAEPSAASKPQLTAEQTAAARAASGIVDGAIARGRLEDSDAAQLREQLRTLAGAPEGQALVARIFAAMNQGKLQVEQRNGQLPFMP